MPTLWQGLRVAGAYIALMAFGTFLVNTVIAPDASTARLWSALFAVQLAGAIFVIAVVMRRYDWRAIGFGRLDWHALVWLAPATVLLLKMTQTVAAETPAVVFQAVPASVWALVVLTPFLIAFSEEVVFRGILLRGALSRSPVIKAMLLSAVGFAVAHLINGLAGQEAVNTLLQAAFAFLVGVSLAPIALQAGNLWPLIIWHWMWNVVVLSSQVMNVLHPFAVIGMAIQAAVSMWLWARLAKEMKAP